MPNKITVMSQYCEHLHNAIIVDISERVNLTSVIILIRIQFGIVCEIPINRREIGEKEK